MSQNPIAEAERIIRHHRRWRTLLVFVVALVVAAIMTWFGVWTWPAHAAEPTAASTQVTTEAASMPTSGPGWSIYGPDGSTQSDEVWMTSPPTGCWAWAAGWIQYPTSCEQHALPGWFRRGVGATMTGCLIGLLGGGSVPVGCLGGALGSVDWG